ncbi:MAG: carboxypeptidase-like regulatory domain-containing protein, partial [Paludibacteraceae bacterium]|nr:carboxypeptidase-like regulatory domain-containing protein [Paludibacteraceae bacterium]
MMQAKGIWTMLLSVLSVTLMAQTTRVSGTVLDAQSLQPLEFVEVSFRGTTVGITTDSLGRFRLQTSGRADTLQVSYLGYKTLLWPVKQGRSQQVELLLHEDRYQLGELIVLPTENPAWPIMRQVAAHRRQNNPDRLENYQYEVYNKMEVDANNVSPKWQQKKLFRSFDFVFDYIDTTQEKPFLPVLITENIADVYHRRSPERFKEVVKASRMSGVENESYAQFTGQMFLDVNIYENYIPAFNHDFLSPVSEYWKANYKYYLQDDSLLNDDGSISYHITFRPRRRQEYTFEGEMWINNADWAVERIRAAMSPDVNLNYVHDFMIEERFERIDSTRFLTYETMFFDFNLLNKALGFYGRRTMTRRNIVIQPLFADNLFSPTAIRESVMLDDASGHTEDYWQARRPDTLSLAERGIYQMVDSVKSVPLYKTVHSIIDMLVGGYYKLGHVEIGPYYKLYSHNQIEGHRFRMGLRTTTKFNPDWRMSVYGAYGTRDQRLKGGVGAFWIVNRQPRRTAALDYKYDYEQLGQSVRALSQDNIMSTMLARSSNRHLLLAHDLRMRYEQEYLPGLSNSFNLTAQWLMPSAYIPFDMRGENSRLRRIESYELAVNTHYRFNEKYVTREFDRFSIGSRYPAIDFTLTAGAWNNRGHADPYLRLVMNVHQNILCGPLGKMNYIIEGGKVFGRVPFTLLKLHEGNESYVFDPYAFNMMNYYEFASDLYLSLCVEQHLNGFLLNHIPLMRRLKWREVVYAKGLVGNISATNSRDNAVVSYPETLGNVNRPYA